MKTTTKILSLWTVFTLKSVKRKYLLLFALYTLFTIVKRFIILTLNVWLILWKLFYSLFGIFYIGRCPFRIIYIWVKYLFFTNMFNFIIDFSFFTFITSLRLNWKILLLLTFNTFSINRKGFLCWTVLKIIILTILILFLL